MAPDAIDVLMDNTLRKAGYGAVLDAALEGDSDAQCYLGMIWKEKIDGVPEPTTLEQALRWYSIAAEAAYDGLRQDAIRHRNGILESLQRLRGINGNVAPHREGPLEAILEGVGSKPPTRVGQDQALAGKIFQTFRSLKIASTSIDDVDVRLGYLEWLQNEDDKWENDPSIGRVMPSGVGVVLLLQAMNSLGIKADQIADADIRSAYETWNKKGEK
jgi:TPR repeat protein